MAWHLVAIMIAIMPSTPTNPALGVLLVFHIPLLANLLLFDLNGAHARLNINNESHYYILFNGSNAFLTQRNYV